MNRKYLWHSLELHKLLFNTSRFQKSRLVISEDTCLFGVGGTIEASQMASAQFTDRTLTSVAARNVHGHTLVIAGSVAGDILQVSFL